MNYTRAAEDALVPGEELRPSEKRGPARPTDSMLGDDVAPPATGVVDVAGSASAPPEDEPRELVRLIQCPQCSRPFRAPVTLPCGHTSCRSCLPAAKPRENISYPDTPDRQSGIKCPEPSCGREHPTGEVNLDVVLLKSMETICAVVDSARAQAPTSPLLTREIPARDEWSEKEHHGEAHSQVLHGGRLLSTFTLADLGELDYRAGIEFDVVPETPADPEAFRQLDLRLLDRLREGLQKEVECQICYNTMLDPVTTSCGHTFCRRCLTRVLDHSSYCPACRRQLPVPPSLSDQPSNARLVKLLDKLCADVVAARADAVAAEESSGTHELNHSLFVCTLSFPSMPTFLHIFEPRYRLMVRRAMESNRQFGMLMYNRRRRPQGDLGVTDFCLYGTMLQIEHLQMLPDGRSIIETRGLYRFKVLETGVRDGYMVGRIERVEDVSLAEEERTEAEEIRAARNTVTPPSASTEALLGPAAPAPSAPHNSASSASPANPHPPLETLTTRELLATATAFVADMRANSAPWLHQRILDAYGQPPATGGSGGDERAAGLFPYWFASVFPLQDEEKYLLLTTTSVRQRLKIVVGWIRGLESRSWWSASNCTVL